MTADMAAIAAENAMLRLHAQRGRRPGRARPRQQWRTNTRYWHAGYSAAMADILEVIAENATAAGDRGEQPWPAAFDAVIAVAGSVTALFWAEGIPASWAEACR